MKDTTTKGLIYLLVVSVILSGLSLAFSFNKQADKSLGYANQDGKFFVSKTITSSAISSTTAVDLTVPVSSGSLFLNNILLETGSTGLAGCTNIKIKDSSTAFGTTTLMETVVTGLGANQSIDITDASVVKKKAILPAGAKLQILAVGADCTGAGTVKVTAIFDKSEAGGYIAE
jgi:hypothetical protein